MSDLSRAEQLVFGADAKRDPVTGQIFEDGLGSAPVEIQAENFLREFPPAEKPVEVAAAPVEPEPVAAPVVEQPAEPAQPAAAGAQ